MRFVEQPQPRTASDEHRQRDTTTLACGESFDRHLGEATFEAHAGCGGEGVLAADARRRGPELEVVPHRQVVVQVGLVSEQPDVRPDTLAIRLHVVAQHVHRAGRDRQESGTRTQERRLADTVRTAQQHDLTRVDRGGCSGERRKSAQQHDGLAQLDRPGHLVETSCVRGIPVDGMRVRTHDGDDLDARPRTRRRHVPSSDPPTGEERA